MRNANDPTSTRLDTPALSLADAADAPFARRAVPFEPRGALPAPLAWGIQASTRGRVPRTPSHAPVVRFGGYRHDSLADRDGAA